MPPDIAVPISHSSLQPEATSTAGTAQKGFDPEGCGPAGHGCSPHSAAPRVCRLLCAPSSHPHSPFSFRAVGRVPTPGCGLGLVLAAPHTHSPYACSLSCPTGTQTRPGAGWERLLAPGGWELTWEGNSETTAV